MIGKYSFIKNTKNLWSLLYYFKSEIQVRMWTLRTPVSTQERTKEKQCKIQQLFKYSMTGFCLLLISIKDREE